VTLGQGGSAQRIVVVTGANRGIGREVARQLAVRGDLVVLGSRDPTKGETAARPAASSGTAARCPGEARCGGAPVLPAPLPSGHPVTVKSADRSSTWTW
jgi:NAD(P)-dependent dehydrogenase (short-subunit alcohol dehydrogenase family)